MTLRPVWSRQTDARLLGLSLAREAGLLLAWDEGHSLYLWDLQGTLRAKQSLLQRPTVAGISDDGSLVVAAAKTGQVWWLNPELNLLFDQSLDIHPLACAIEPLGQLVALSGRDKRTHLYARTGKRITGFETPRALHSLTFVPSEPRLLGAADYGFLGCFDSKGQCLWREALVSNVGALSTTGDGRLIVLASFTQGLQRFDLSGKNLGPLATPHPCRQAAVDFDGSFILAATEASSLSLLKTDGAVRGDLHIPCAASAVVFGALGNVGGYGLPSGEVTLVEVLPR